MPSIQSLKEFQGHVAIKSVSFPERWIYSSGYFTMTMADLILHVDTGCLLLDWPACSPASSAIENVTGVNRCY